VERGVTTPRPAYGVGEVVAVASRPSFGHVRTPRYVQQHQGRVSSVHGAFPDPESLAHGGDGSPHRWLYEVAFDSTALWGPDRGTPGDTVCADVFEHWLQRPDQREGSTR
jgi:hypothetical protein